jgi:hypothetical protein
MAKLGTRLGKSKSDIARPSQLRELLRRRHYTLLVPPSVLGRTDTHGWHGPCCGGLG